MCVAQQKIVSFSPSNVVVLYSVNVDFFFVLLRKLNKCVCTTVWAVLRIRYHISKWNLFLLYLLLFYCFFTHEALKSSYELI